MTKLGGMVGTLSHLQRMSISIPMNSITIHGLGRFMDAILHAGARCKGLREMFFDVSGNFIRGPDFGKELSRTHAGGWFPPVSDTDCRPCAACAYCISHSADGVSKSNSAWSISCSWGKVKR